jgi:hypothetical protein
MSSVCIAVSIFRVSEGHTGCVWVSKHVSFTLTIFPPTNSRVRLAESCSASEEVFCT